MKRKKICFISYHAYSLFRQNDNTTFGGSEVQMYQYAKILATKGIYKISFLVADYGQNYEEYIDGIRICKVFSLNRKGIFKFIYKPFSNLKLLYILNKNNSDVYVHRAAGIETGVIAFYCKLFQKKFIYMTASTIDTNREYQHFRPFEGLFYEWGLRHATHVICQSHEQQIGLKNNYQIKASIINNSFNIPPKNLTKRDYILWVGSTQTLKQPYIFLDLVKSFPKYQFVMIMPPNDYILWQQIISNIVTIKNLVFIKHVPFNKINSYFANAKLFINTSIFEGFPNTFVQATMHGTPIISLNVNPDNFLNKNKCGFCAQGNFKKLQKYTQSLFTNNKLWLIMSKNCYTYAKDNHDINKNITSLIEILNL